MRMPIVTEITRRLEPVAHDPFIDDLRTVVVRLDIRADARSGVVRAPA
jgi:hypothetical protein